MRCLRADCSLVRVSRIQIDCAQNYKNGKSFKEFNYLELFIPNQTPFEPSIYSMYVSFLDKYLLCFRTVNVFILGVSIVAETLSRK